MRALDGEMLPLMVFALIFGFAISRAPAADGERNILIRVFDQVFDACMRIVGWAMVIAPLAVFAIVFNTARTFGTDVFAGVLLYVATVVAGLLVQQFVVYSVMLRLAARRSPLEFFRDCREVLLYAFSTASSNATLPVSIKAAETKLRLSPRVARFVLTVGSTANQNGTALFEGVTILFLAQAYGLDLTVGQQVRVMVMSIVAGIGTAGVPGGSLPMVLIVAQSVGVPAEGMGLILGVDRFLDMCRTAVNVSGDLVIAALVDRPQRLTHVGPPLWGAIPARPDVDTVADDHPHRFRPLAIQFHRHRPSLLVVHLDLHASVEQVHVAEEVGDKRRCRVLDHLAGRRILLDLPLVHHHDPIGQLEGFLLVVRDKDAGEMNLLMQPAQPATQLLPHLGVKRAERLVEEQHFRLDRERTGQRHPLTLAAGELRRIAIAKVVELDETEQLMDAALDLVLGGTLVTRSHPKPEGDVLEDRHVPKQRVMLEDKTHTAMPRILPGGVVAVEEHGADIRCFEAGDHPQQRRLA